MVLEVHKQERENARRLIRRFSRIIRQTGILTKARKAQFFERPLSKTKKKLAALRRERIKQERERLKKLGKL